MKKLLMLIAIVFSGMLMQAQLKETTSDFIDKNEFVDINGMLPFEKITKDLLYTQGAPETYAYCTVYGALILKTYIEGKRDNTIIRVKANVRNGSIVQQLIEDNHDYDFLRRGRSSTDYWYGSPE